MSERAGIERPFAFSRHNAKAPDSAGLSKPVAGPHVNVQPEAFACSLNTFIGSERAAVRMPN